MSDHYEEMYPVSRQDQQLIDVWIGDLIVQQKECNLEMEKQILEFSIDLSTGNTRLSALQSRNFFLRFWGKLTGKTEKAFELIQGNQMAALYAMEKFMEGMIESSRISWRMQNEINKALLKDICSLNQDQTVIHEELLKIKQMIVSIFSIVNATEEEDQYCKRCGCRLTGNQYLCPHCYLLHHAKASNLPSEVMHTLQTMETVMSVDSPPLNPDIVWSQEARQFADSLVKARSLATAAGVFSENSPVYQNVSETIEECKQAEFQIAVAGTMKAGKSLLLNAMLGAELAPVDSNSATAALTKFHSSSNGNFVKISFHTTEQWENLVQENEHADDTFRNLMNIAEGMSPQWINRSPILYYFETVPEMKECIHRWVAADSLEHLFVREVEVGIDYHSFPLPKEVVFVDTPGLHDVAAYRSQITRQYIMRADAVLLAIPIKALDQQDADTISLILDQAGKNKNNVFVIGTKKDLVKKGDLEQYLSGRGGWVSLLIKNGCYQNESEFRAHLFTVSALDHLGLETILGMNHEERRKYVTDYDEEYMDLNYHVKRILPPELRDGFELSHLESRDCLQFQIAEESFGVHQLTAYLQKNLIAEYARLRITELRKKVLQCHKEIALVLENELKEQKRNCETISMGEDKIREQLAAIHSEKKHAESRRNKIRKDLLSLH